MQKLVLEAINTFEAIENFQVINVNNIDKLNTEVDIVIYGIKNTNDLKKIESFLSPYYPLGTIVEIFSGKSRTSEKVPLNEISNKNDIEVIHIKPNPDKRKFCELVSIISRLRSPDGCPWDLKQTVDTIKGHLIEETYEVVDAINRKDYPHLKEELGDLLLQVILHCQIASQCGEFTLDDVLFGINEKLIRRHPHVFANGKAKTPSDVISEWEKIKKKEKKKKSFMDGIPKGLPALNYAQKIQTKASRVGFDWLDAKDVFKKLDEEINEFKNAKNLGRDKQEEELGDIFFALVNYGRKIGIDCESALIASSEKFKRRFKEMEEIAKQKGEEFTALSIDEKEKLWNKVKGDKWHQ